MILLIKLIRIEILTCVIKVKVTFEPKHLYRIMYYFYQIIKLY